VLESVARLEALDARREEELLGRVEDADAVIVYRLDLSRRTIERLEHGRIIVRGGVGHDRIDGAFARERGIPVANVPDYCTEEVADSALGLMLTLTRGLSSINTRLQAAAVPWSFSEAAPLRRLRGRVLGIVGLGRIGTATALRAKSLGMEVAYYDPYRPLGYDKALGLRRTETLEELVSSSWILSLHCPLTPETRGMIDARMLSLLPLGAYLVNTPRRPPRHGGDSRRRRLRPAGRGRARRPGERAPRTTTAGPLLARSTAPRAWRSCSPHSAFYSEESRRELGSRRR
jgi:D-3-phosphoglycerate dehydrogenase/C-terminal binding protein